MTTDVIQSDRPALAIAIEPERTREPGVPSVGRDLRLDLFRGLANWAIFLDHIPNNAIAWLTTRNYEFSDAADVFVFISGIPPLLCTLAGWLRRDASRGRRC